MKRVLIVLLLCAILLTAACGKNDSPASSAAEETIAAPTDVVTTEASADTQTVPDESAAPTETAAPAQTTEESGPVEVTVHWADAVPQDLLKAQQYTAIEDEFSTLVLFKSNRTAKDFRFLGLELVDFDDDGNASFRCETLVKIDAIAPNQPAAIRTAFFGDIPNNGFSFVDENGQTQYYTLSISGENGALVTEPFVPA